MIRFMSGLVFVCGMTTVLANVVVVDVTRETFGIYEQCMNGKLRQVRITTKDNVRQFDNQCVEVMQNTQTYKDQDLNNQSAINQRTLKFRAELMEVIK